MRGTYVKHLFLAVAALLPFTSCGPALSETPEQAQALREAIIDGGVVPNDEELSVVAVAVRYGGGGGSFVQQFCTGSLIAPKTVLTAAHCINPQELPSQLQRVIVIGTQPTGNPARTVNVASRVAHPDYNGATPTWMDFGLLELATAVTDIEPLPMNDLPMSNAAHSGLIIRHVGFGNSYGGSPTTQGSGSGTKRRVEYPVRTITSNLIESALTNKQNTCQGDSGGPGLMTLPGHTREHIVGVVSYGGQYCLTDGYDWRVDRGLTWIHEEMAKWEGASCNLDNLCKEGCTPMDQDCACAADGQCTTACADTSRDPDCPANCHPNNVCETADCPTPDPDCILVGNACSGNSQCQSRECINDPQHEQRYCSAACVNDESCPGVLVCLDSKCSYPQKPVKGPVEWCTPGEDFCDDGTTCNGPQGQDPRCVYGCNTTTDCLGDEVCEGGSNGQRYCRPPGLSFLPEPIVTPLLPQTLGSEFQGCAVSGVAVLWLLPLLLRRRSRK